MALDLIKLHLYYAITLASVFSLMALMFVAPSPIALAILILFQTILLCKFLTNLLSPWFTLTLFLLYAGGIMVMLMYFASTSPNQLMPLHISTIVIISMFFISFTTMFFNYFPAGNLNHNPPIYNYTSALFLPQNISTLLFLACILFITLVGVVSISSRSGGPLRPFIKSKLTY